MKTTMTMNFLEKKLAEAGRKQAALYLFCNFVSLLLITAYAAMMFSPTVLEVLPTGGDSRKQMIAIFVLALFGCVVFTIYASALFFRKKSRQLGVLMALGASRKKLAPGLYKEVLILSGISSFAGVLAGLPFVYLLWGFFRLFIVESSQMTLRLDYRFLFLSIAFFFLVVTSSCFTAYRYLRRTNIMDVVHEEHKNEPVKELGRWCGPVGILLTFAGAACGYLAPEAYMKLFSALPGIWINLLYVPVFAGLYMIMLHTVIHGWRSHRKTPYKNIIARSMMKFQGRQTVNNLLICTVLIAGASFALFYLPTLGVNSYLEVRSRSFDYYYHYRLDQTQVPSQSDIAAMAAGYGMGIKDFRESPYASLALDGYTYVFDDDNKNSYHIDHIDLAAEGKFFSASAYRTLTGEPVTVADGTYYAVTNADETNLSFLDSDATFLTNMVTRQTLPVSFAGYVHYDMLADSFGYYILSDRDYDAICQGLTEDWMGSAAFFNADGEDSPAFASDFFYTLVNSFGPECEHTVQFSRVVQTYFEEAGKEYFYWNDPMFQISYDRPDDSSFRAWWSYMPKIRLLDQEDFLKTYAVFLMMFLFISIICILAASVISYTRCMTIALNNRYIFDDLKRLGASPAFLVQEIRNQCGNVFRLPALIGMSIIYLLYALILYVNDGKITAGEAGGMAVSLLLLLCIGGLFFSLYRYTVKQMAKQLNISVPKRKH